MSFGAAIGLLFYTLQQLGMALGVGGITTLFGIAVKRGSSEFSSAAYTTARFGFWAVFFAGAVITAVHLLAGDPLYSSSEFKWFLILLLLIAAGLSHSENFSRRYLLPFELATWYALFVLYVVSPTGSLLIFLGAYAVWAFAVVEIGAHLIGNSSVVPAPVPSRMPEPANQLPRATPVASPVAVPLPTTVPSKPPLPATPSRPPVIGPTTVLQLEKLSAPPMQSAVAAPKLQTPVAPAISPSPAAAAMPKTPAAPAAVKPILQPTPVSQKPAPVAPPLRPVTPLASTPIKPPAAPASMPPSPAKPSAPLPPKPAAPLAPKPADPASAQVPWIRPQTIPQPISTMPKPAASMPAVVLKPAAAPAFAVPLSAPKPLATPASAPEKKPVNMPASSPVPQQSGTSGLSHVNVMPKNPDELAQKGK